MTRVSAYHISKSPCCGRHYSTISYASLNFSSGEFWTDGYRKNSLTPNDHNLRKCECGGFYLTSELIYLETVSVSDVPFTKIVSAEELPQVIIQARNNKIELAARWDYWHYLNHAYREKYRLHRDAEDKLSKQDWLSKNPDKRTIIDKLRKVKPPTYVLKNDRPFTYPKFEPTEIQIVNMKELLELFISHVDSSSFKLEIAELYRELGDFESSTYVISGMDLNYGGILKNLIGEMSEKEDSAPIRFHS